MQSNSNAGIIIYRETKMPQVLSTFAQPKLEANITIRFDTQDINIYLFDCPVNGAKIDKKRYRLLRELMEKNRVKFLVERFEAKVQSNVSPRKNELHYSQLLTEVKGIKLLASLIKISQERQENFLAGDIGFITGSIDSQTIDILSEEAANVMLYEGPAFTEQLKLKLHNHFMEKKGVSIVFTKEITSIISSCTVIYIDEDVDLKDYAAILHNKIVIGKSKDSRLRCINNITLWYEDLKSTRSPHIPLTYNDEILAIMRYYNIKLDIIEFIKRLPYIYIDY